MNLIKMPYKRPWPDDDINQFNEKEIRSMLLEDEAPEILYHYCSIDTFKTILTNRTIRLTDIFRMKDSSEVTHVLELLPVVLAEEYAKNPFPFQYKSIDNEKAFAPIVSDIKRKINDVKFSSYIACFSKFGDDHFQWKHYGDDGKGVAIGCDKKILDDVAAQCQCGEKITEVIYDEKKQKEYIILTIVPRIFEAIKNAGNYKNVKSGYCPRDNMVQICINSDISAILLSAIIYKSIDYKDENEWRLYKNIPEITQLWRSEGSKRYSIDQKYGDIVMKPILDIKKPTGDTSTCIDLDLEKFKNASKIIKKIILGPKFTIKDVDVRNFLRIINFDMGLPCVAYSEIQKSRTTM